MVENSPENDALDPIQKDWGFEYMYQRFLAWTDSLSKQTFVRNAVLGAVASVVLVTVATVLNFNSTLQALIAVPAAIALFCILLAWTHRNHDPDQPTVRERFSASRRRQVVIVVSAVFVAVMIFLGTHIPYAVGGTLAVVGVLTLYNIARRTPIEIAMDRAGVVDPRDYAEEEAEEVQEYLDGLEDQEQVWTPEHGFSAAPRSTRNTDEEEGSR